MRSVVPAWSLCACAALAVASPASAQTPLAPVPDTFDLRAGAWDRSVQLEREGKLELARAILLLAWGDASDSYEVTVRLAWLSQRLGQTDQAAAYYQRARTLRGAGPEATQGLANVSATAGYDRLAQGDRDGARKLFEQAIQLDPSNERARKGLEQVQAMPTIEPELWGAYVRKPDQGGAWNGWAAFGQIPWHVTGSLTLRGAFRHVELSRDVRVPAVPPPGMPPGPRPGGKQTQTWRQDEVYAGIGWEKPWYGFEALGLGLFPSDEATAWGAAGRARLGRRLGGNLEGSAIQRESGWNGQVLPTLYWWPSDSVGLAVGPRTTRDPSGTAVSAYGGLTIKTDRLTWFLSGHAGTERWPVTMAIPSVLTVDQDLRYGMSTAALVSVSRTVRLGIAGQLERISLGGSQATYATVSAGIQLAPRF